MRLKCKQIHHILICFDWIHSLLTVVDGLGRAGIICDIKRLHLMVEL